MAAHVEQGTAAGHVGVPEVGGVRAGVGLAARTEITSPIAPSSIIWRARTTLGANTSVSA